MSVFFGAEDEAQTRDPQLGRLMLYQLSYFRNLSSGRRWIRTTEGINQQIYSLPHLATLVFALTQTFAILTQCYYCIFIVVELPCTTSAFQLKCHTVILYKFVAFHFYIFACFHKAIGAFPFSIYRRNAFRQIVCIFRASCRIRTNDPEITNHVLWPTELKRHVSIFSFTSVLVCDPNAVAKLRKVFKPQNFFQIFFTLFAFFSQLSHIFSFFTPKIAP